MVGKQITGETRIKTYYSLMTILTIAIFGLYITYAQKLNQIGKFWFTIIYVILCESSKLILIRKWFNLDNTPKGEIGYKPKKLPSNIKTKLVESLKFSCLLVASSVVYAFICIVLGASPLGNYEETFTLACLMTILTLMPLTLFVGANGTISILFTENFDLQSNLSNSYLNLLKRNSFVVIFGAWAGSVVVPLDWDRAWQNYPIGNIVGALGGHFAVSFYCLGESVLTQIKSKKG